MKKILVLIAALVVGFQEKADNNIPVTLEQMPAPAQEFIKTHFAAKTMTFAVLEKERHQPAQHGGAVAGCSAELSGSGHRNSLLLRFLLVCQSRTPVVCNSSTYRGFAICRPVYSSSFFKSRPKECSF